MFPIVVIAVFIALTHGMVHLIHQHLDNRGDLAVMVQKHDVSKIAADVALYFKEKGVFPSSLAALKSTTGFEHTASAIDSNTGIGYSVTTLAISDAVAPVATLFHRASVYRLDIPGGETSSSFEAINSCGAGGFASAVSWCPNITAWAWRMESRDVQSDMFVLERVHQQRLINRFASYYNKYKFFPVISGTLPTSASMPSLVGYAGTAAGCSGTFLIQAGQTIPSAPEIPLGCEDIFSVWGLPRFLNTISSQNIAFVSNSPVLRASGNTPITVSVDLAL